MSKKYYIDKTPQNRLAELGPHTLSNPELLSILVQAGIPNENAIQVGLKLIEIFKNFTGLHNASYEELCEIHGIGPTKAAQLKAAIKIGKRLSSEIYLELPQITRPSDAASLVMHEMSVLPQEQLRVMLLNTKNQVLEIKMLYQGSLNSSTVRIGEIFKRAIIKNAAAAIIIHNHPSGDPEPSQDDIKLTRALVEAGKLLNITIHDHIVIGKNRFVSMKDRLLGF